MTSLSLDAKVKFLLSFWQWVFLFGCVQPLRFTPSPADIPSSRPALPFASSSTYLQTTVSFHQHSNHEKKVFAFACLLVVAVTAACANSPFR